MDPEPSRAGCAAAFHGLSSGFQIARQTANASGNARPRTADRAQSGPPFRLRRQYFQRGGEYLLPELRAAADPAVVARRAGRPTEPRVVLQVRAENSGGLGSERTEASIVPIGALPAITNGEVARRNAFLGRIAAKRGTDTTAGRSKTAPPRGGSRQSGCSSF